MVKNQYLRRWMTMNNLDEKEYIEKIILDREALTNALPEKIKNGILKILNKE